MKWTLGLALSGLAIAGAILVKPALAAGLVGVAVVAVAAVVHPDRYRRGYGALLAVVLVGYAMLGRGFAYVGVEPLYIGEMALGLGLVALLASDRGLGRTLRSPIVGLLLAYMTWGAWRTIPYLGTHGVGALRDAVLWGYTAFAVIVAALLLAGEGWRRVPEGYRRWLPWLLVWLPFGYLASTIWIERLPRMPGTDVTIPLLKPGDVAVHLAGAGAFLLLGLWDLRDRRRAWLEWVLWGLWALTFVAAATKNRGGMVAVVVALGLVMVLRPSWRWFKIGMAGATLLAVLVAADVRVDIPGERDISARQLARNAVSVVGDETGSESLQGTADWRRRWWGDIVDYTVFGPYFWSGKGFGINLANADGYQVDWMDESLRSPHNGHLTVLARAGVPGFVLWILLHGFFGVSLLLAHFRARREGREGWARIDLWILAYWTAFMVNATFDVFLEGPMGGIWFWSLMGGGIAALEIQRRLPHAAEARA
ncbi:MAG: O-antigen ligase family protein [Gemmatimonadetes bacterium]|nr:O-antigen ligase family protein [Gemmatimonadota bacterium]